MWRNIEWEYQIAKIKYSDHCNSKLLNAFYTDKCLEQKKIVKETNMITIINHKSFMYFEAEYIFQNENAYFIDVIDKFCDKAINDMWYYFSPNREMYFENEGLAEELSIYDNYINNNNISLGDIEREKIIISPYFFDTLKENYLKYDKEKIDELNVLNYMIELFSLFVIAEKTTMKKDVNGCTMSFVFEIKSDDLEKKLFEVKWKDWTFFKHQFYFESYKWLRENDGILINNDVKLQIIRGEISRGKSFSVSKDSISKYQTILNRIINNETKEYFEQQNKLKEEFIELKKMKLESSRQLKNKLLGLITTMSVAYYGLIHKNDGTLNISSPNEAVAILFFCAILATLFFFLVQILDFFDRRYMYSELEDIYVDKLNFDRNDFSTTVSKPQIIDMWKDFVILTFFLILLFLLMKYYMGGVQEVVNLVKKIFYNLFGN